MLFRDLLARIHLNWRKIVPVQISSVVVTDPVPLDCRQALTEPIHGLAEGAVSVFGLDSRLLYLYFDLFSDVLAAQN